MIRLQERTTALYSAPASSFPSQFCYFVEWLRAEPFFATTLSALPDLPLSAEDWMQQNVQWGQDVGFPQDEAEAVAACWLVVGHMAAQQDVGNAIFQFASGFSNATHTDDINRAFLDVFVEPVLTWLKERILTDDLVLSSLDRYAHEAAWFRRDKLRAEYEADTARGEETLDRDLRHQLFREGINFPFSQVQVPSGRPDIVVPDEEAQPLPLEVKVYDPARNRDKQWARKGFAQAIEYARDFRRSDSYLAVFDASSEGLAISGDDPADHLPSIRSSGITVFIVVVPIGDPQAASKRRSAKRVTLDAAFFLSSPNE